MPAARLGTGSGVLNMARQVGTVLGVAGLVAALGAPAADPLTAFRYGILVIITLFVAAGAVCLADLARPVQPAPVAGALQHDRPREVA